MKRRFRSSDYKEEQADDGTLYVMHLRIRDSLRSKTYHAEWVVRLSFAAGMYFYYEDEEPIDNQIPQAVREYAERAFKWRMRNREKEQHVLA